MMLLISCICFLCSAYFRHHICHLRSLDMFCNATYLVSNYHVCEFCNAILLQDIIYVNYAMRSCCKALCMWIIAMPCSFAKRHICELYHAVLFGITHCICRQRLYIELLFMCISHLKWGWKYLEWKHGLQTRQSCLLKQISCWLQIAP